MTVRKLLAFVALIGVSCASQSEADLQAAEQGPSPASMPVARPLPAIPPPQRAPQAAPAMSLTDAEKAKFTLLPVRADAVPVILIHALCTDACPVDDLYSFPLSEFVRVMLMARAAGYATITPGQYVRFMHGDKRGLPERPLLLTFDDGYASAYLLGDAVLQGLGARATMFVITDKPEYGGDTTYVSWPEWRTAAATGRWNLQLHAHEGHVKIPYGVDSQGAVVTEASYAERVWDRVYEPGPSHLESFESWRERVEGDMDTGQALMAARLHKAYEPLLFAVPFGNYGQRSSNDDNIGPALSASLDRRFQFWFTQVGNAEFTVPGGATHERNRYTILNTTKAEAVYSWLKRRAVETNP